MTNIPNSVLEYAMVLAWTAHLDHLKASFDKIAESPQLLMETTCWAEEMTVGIRVIRNYAMRTLADQCAAKELDSGDDSFRSKDLLVILADNGASVAEVGSSRLLEEVIESLDKPTEAKNALIQDPIVYERLYSTLKGAALRTFSPALPEEEATALLSKLFTDYLSTQQSNLTSVNAFEGLASKTTEYLRSKSSIHGSWNDTLETFRFLLEYRIEVSPVQSESKISATTQVSKLRELGNNLMANTCYPQAIKVYSDAIHCCTRATSRHLPQLLTNRAIAFIGLNCFPEAVSDLQTAILYDQTFVPAWTQLGYCELYLGPTMLALKCYLTALRCLAGEIYPLNFPADEGLRQQYTEAKALTVMPQFVQKLVLSIVLSAKRAQQQREPNLTIQEITTRVRAILARLRAHVLSEDLHFLSYVADPAAESLRSSAIRADTIRPTILTPDVAQDIMASANVEASAVTINGPGPTAANLPVPILPTAIGTPQDPAGQPEIPQLNIPGNLRGLLNTFGNIVSDVVQPPPAQPTEPRNESDSDPAVEQPPSGDSATTSPPNAGDPNNLGPENPNSHVARALSSVRRALNIVQPNASGTGNGQPNAHSGIMDAALRQHQAAIERMLGGNHGANFVTVSGNPAQTTQVRSSTLVTSPDGTTTTVHRDSNNPATTSNQQTPSAEDTDMPDAPDLD